MPVALVVFAGGASRRFQRPGEAPVDKCKYPVEGRPMIERVVEAARPLVDAVYVAPGRKAGYGPPAIEDSPRFEGPMAAVDSAAARLSGWTLLFAPCDVPYITTRAFRELLAAEGSAVYVTPNGLVESHVFKAEADALAEALNAAVGRGGRLDDLFRLSRRASYLSPLAHGVAPKELLNVNYREDLAAEPQYGEALFDSDLVLSWDPPPLLEHIRTKSPEPLWRELRVYLESGLLSMAAHVLEDLATNNKRLGALAGLIKSAVGIRKARST
ncbi:MAG: molybdenum cofactor guanylyltransferase [Thermoproteus sp. AZ2]|uniref:Molybdenum cofactor guanylyltransferase n=1 Tax=Thermoproteus sp. AZ2 TaxID=1609232 RepID=A0ACC6V068_9CREN